MPDENVMFYIDGTSLLHGVVQDFNRIDIDFERLVETLLNKRKLIRVYYYSSMPSQQNDPEIYKKQQRFIEALKKKPYFIIRLGRLVKRSSGFVEKGVDVKLVCDLLEHGFWNLYDTAIIVNGDGDFANAARIVRGLGRRVENACTQSYHSTNLEATCDKTIILDQELLKNCWKNMA